MISNNISFFYQTIRILALAAVVLVGLAGQAAFAQTPSVTLTVNNGASANIIFGQSVLLEWYAVGVTNCVINNGVGLIPNDELPSGSLEVVPESNVSYTMVCEGGSDSVLVGINPVVTLSASPNPVTVGFNGRAPVTVTWTSEYATQCDRLSYTTDSNQTVWLNTSNPSRTPDHGKTSGSQYYGNSPNEGLRESATFRLVCRNIVTGASGVAEVYLEVRQRETIADPVVSISANRQIVSPDENFGFGRAQITLASDNISYCNRRAFDLQNNPITVPGWTDVWSGRLNGADTVNMSTTTRFTAYCGRAIDNRGTSSNSIVIAYEGGEVLLRERTLSFTAPASLEITNLIAGTVQGQVSYDARPTANRCSFRAFNTLNEEINVPGWTGRWSGHLHANNLTLTFATTTRLRLSCVRDFDSSWETLQPTVLVTRNEDDRYLAPSLRVSGYRHTIEAESFEDLDNFRSGDSSIYSNNQTLLPLDAASLAEASTPFTGRAGTYDVYVQYCDERLSEATMGLAIDGQQFETWQSDHELERAGCDSSTLRIKRVATNVALEPESEIDLWCETTQGAGVSGARPCRIDFIRFVDAAYEVSVPVSPETGLVSQQIVWQGENVTRCTVREATTFNGVSYQFSNNSGTARVENLNNIATSTTFRVVCDRPGDGESVEGQFSVIPVLPQQIVALEQTAEIFVGDCIDSNLIITGSGGGVVTPIPPGFAADANGICISNPADLYISSYGVSEQGTWNPDHVSGTYDNVELRLVYTNRGPGAFLAPVSYRFDVQYNQEPGALFEPDETWIESHTPGSVMGENMSSPILRVVSNVPFGTHTVRARINQDPETIYEGGLPSVFDDNEVNYTFVVPPPLIPMSITTEPRVIRQGQPTTVNWQVESGYLVNCVMVGPGINESFDLDPITAGGLVTVTDVSVSANLQSTAEFTLTCTEPTTNTVFVRTQRVEVSPDVVEI